MENTTNLNFEQSSGTYIPSSTTSWYAGPSILDNLEQKVRILTSVIREKDIQLSGSDISKAILEQAKAALLQELKDHFGDLISTSQDLIDLQAEANRFYNRDRNNG